MIEILQYPMALYHPITKAMTIVDDEKHHEDVLSAWADELKEENDEAEEQNVVSISKRKPGRPKKA